MTLHFVLVIFKYVFVQPPLVTLIHIVIHTDQKYNIVPYMIITTY